MQLLDFIEAIGRILSEVNVGRRYAHAGPLETGEGNSVRIQVKMIGGIDFLFGRYLLKRLTISHILLDLHDSQLAGASKW